MRVRPLGILCATALAGLLASCVNAPAPSKTRPANSTSTPAPPAAAMQASSYRAFGNEPFWSATVADGRLLLDQPGGPQRAVTVPAPQATADGHVYEARGMRMEVVRQRCEDSMSGAAFSDRVTLSVDGKRLQGCGGERLPPQRLEGTQWAVVTLDGQAVDLQPPPTLAIDAQGRVTGSDGCNRFGGGLAFDASGTVQASGHGVSTKMACIGERDTVSRRYNALRGGVSSWRFEQGMLVLSTGDGRTIRLRQSF